jgi:hypothetical protein
VYSEQKIIMRLEAASKVLGWVPEPHSIDEVERFSARMKTLEYTDPNHPSVVRIVRDPTPMEKRFIRNEIQMCACDANYWLTRYAYLKDETNTIRRFQWRIPQTAAYRVIQDMEAQNRSIEIQWLKGRQLGVSTIIELLTAHRALFGYGVNAVIASVDKDKSEKMAGMIFLAVDQCPWWLKPTEDQRKIGKLLSFLNQSSISIQSGNQMSGIARGTTPTCIHLSEIADYMDPADLIEASLFRAVHPSPKVFMNLESTGNSNVGWWADTWRFNKAHWHEGKARLRPVFLPWFMGVDIYPMATWLHDHPILYGWKPMSETVAHIHKCNAYVRNTALLTGILGPAWTLPADQAWFWEVNYLEHKAKRIEKKWLQEMPADDYEALQSRQEKIFPYEVLTRMEEERDKNYDIYAIVGEGIEDKFYPMDTDIDYALPRIPLSWTHNDKTYRWYLVPLSIQDVENTDAMKWNTKLFVYEYPETGKKYSVGIDTAGGGGADRTVFSIDRVEEGEEPDVQVAELASDGISAAESYAFAMALCSWYDAYMVACEQIRKPGDICQLQMKQMGWPSHRVHSFVRYDGKKIQKSKATKKGWYTTSWSRPLLLSMFIAAVENGWYKVNSKYLKEECDNFEARYTDSGMTKMEHAQGKHDDRLFGAAISYFIAHDLSKMIERSKRKYSTPAGKLPELVLAPCTMNVVPFGQIWGKKYPGHALPAGGPNVRQP